MHTHIAFFFIKWGLVRNKGALPFCRLWSKPAKDESFIFSRFLLLSRQPEVKAIRRKPDIDANHVLFTFYMIA